MKNLEKFGVETLSTQEMIEIDGGGWVGNALRKVGGAIVDAIDWVGEKIGDVVKWGKDHVRFNIGGQNPAL